MRGAGIFLPLSLSVIIEKKISFFFFQIFRTDFIKADNQIVAFAINYYQKENDSSKQRSWQFPRPVKYKAIRICDLCQLLTLVRPFSSTAASPPRAGLMPSSGPQTQPDGPTPSRHGSQGGALFLCQLWHKVRAEQRASPAKDSSCPHHPALGILKKMY